MSQMPHRYQEPDPLDAADAHAQRGSDSESYRICGSAADNRSWQYTLTKRAARQLWFELTRVLYPDRSDEVIAQVTTMTSAPSLNAEPSALTSAVSVTRLASGACMVYGWNGPPGWIIRLDPYEVYRFWASLDTALFPTGW